MTLNAFAENIVETVENIESHEEAVGLIEAILHEVLEPRDRKEFAKWGYPDMKTNPDKCWD